MEKIYIVMQGSKCVAAFRTKEDAENMRNQLGGTATVQHAPLLG